MKGHLRERSPGHWAIVITVLDATGKKRRKWHSFRGSKREAQRECARLIAELTRGSFVEPSRTTLAKYLDDWLGHTKASVTPRTHERYAEIVANYLDPVLGKMLLTKLQPFAISTAYDTIRASRKKGEGPLSARTILHCHRVLSAALRQAVRWRLLPYNPAADVKPPKIERRRINTYTLTEAADVLEAMRGSWMHVPAMLGVLCGLRRGEIEAAVRWTWTKAASRLFKVPSRARRASGTRSRSQGRRGPWRCRLQWSPTCKRTAPRQVEGFCG